MIKGGARTKTVPRQKEAASELATQMRAVKLNNVMHELYSAGYFFSEILDAAISVQAQRVAAITNP